MWFRVVLALLLLAASPAAAQTSGQPDQITVLLERVRDVLTKGDRGALESIVGGTQRSLPLEELAGLMSPRSDELVIKERDRQPLENGGQRLLLEIFAASGIEGRVGTWQTDVVPSNPSAPDTSPWRIIQMERLSVALGLLRLSLDTTKQYRVDKLTVTAPDLALEMPSGSAFLASAPNGPTAVVLIGRGRMRFTPPDPAERTQVRIFAGEEHLDLDFDIALIRVRPDDFPSLFPNGTLTAGSVVPGDLRKATEYFEDNVGRSLRLDLNDLSRDRWSLVPQSGDLIAEVRTKKFGGLTYARVWSDAEDITLFDRKRRKNISVYGSKDKLALRGRFFSEDDLVDYDVLSYDIDADFSPDRLWIDGRARLHLRVQAPVLTSLTLKIAEPLAVRSVASPELGRLMFLRIVGQNSVIVNLPAPLQRNTVLDLQVVYGGRLEPQELDREAITVSGQQQDQETFILPPEPRYIYSNRSYWYPQATVTDYATARLRITLPADYSVVASGEPAGPPAPAPGPVRPGERARRTFLFEANRPVRYLAYVVSRFNTVTSAELQLPSLDDTRRAAPVSASGDPPSASAAEAALSLVVQANPRQASRARGTADRTTDILQYYSSIVGEAPYPSFTVALSENDLPGGHSPAYFAILNQPLPTSQVVWRNDPVSFDSYPSFFLAHELAHQWWGQAIGWKNYHEQWLSEGFSQYFAAMYAARERGNDVFEGVLRQMRRWAIDASPQGPIYLGYRLGHIRSDGRVFRSVVYNKSALVLHMLRRLIGDEAFFNGIRRFYADWRFKKAATDDLRVAMEQASGRKLDAFFEAWIYRSDIPRIRYSTTVKGSNVSLRFEQSGPAVPVPVLVRLTYTGGSTEEFVVPLLDAITTRDVTLTGTLRTIDINPDSGSLAIFEK